MSFITADDKNNPWDEEEMPSLADIAAMLEALTFAKVEIARLRRIEEAAKHLVLEWNSFHEVLEANQP